MHISVIIPSYNCARYLPLAIDSALAQTLPPAEILVVDDGSTDDTRAVIRSRYGDRVRYLAQSNAGPSAARNHGIREARGEIIGFLDADDTWFPQALSQAAQCFAAYPEVALVTADKQAIDAEGRVTEPSWWTRHGIAGTLRQQAGRPLENALPLLLRTNFVNTSLAFVRRDVLADVGLFDESIRFGEDLELWLRIARAHGLACLPEVLGQYRQHGGNVTRATEAMLKDLVRVHRKIASWGKAPLGAAGVDPGRLVAEALCNLGYWYFHAGRYADARQQLWQSLATHPTGRALKYALASLLPSALLGRLRQDPGTPAHQADPSPIGKK